MAIADGRARDTGCLLGDACGLCQIRAEQAAADRAHYADLQQEISMLIAGAVRRNAAASATSPAPVP